MGFVVVPFTSSFSGQVLPPAASRINGESKSTSSRGSQRRGGPPCLWHDGRHREMPAPTVADVRVIDAPENSRFEVRVGGELAGFAEYRRRPSLIAFTHTMIDPRFEGQGLAHRLVTTALSEARSAGLAVLPFCPFVRSFIAGHADEYLDLVPSDLRGNFDLPADA
jgi:uncharacterized protein